MKNKKLKTAFLSSLFLFLSTSCDTKQAGDNISGSIEETVENVLPNLYVALAQLAAFLVMVFVFFKFAYKPLKKKMKERQEHIAKNITEAEEKNSSADRMIEDANANLKASHTRADEIINEAKKTAEQSAQSIIDDANEKANQIRIQGEKDAEEIKKEVDRKAHDEIVFTALAASKEILGREINKEDNEKVVDDFINKIKQGK